MTKKIVPLLAIPLLLGGVVTYFAINSSDSGTNILDSSITLAEVVSKQFRGEEDLSVLKGNNHIDESIIGKLDEMAEALKEQDNVTFNLDEFFEENYTTEIVFDEEISSSPSVEDLEGELDVNIDERQPTEIEEDNRIFQEEGVSYISVSDLDFSHTGSDIVAYKQVNMIIYKEDVPQTYKMMVEDPENFYSYTTYKQSSERDNPFVDVLFTSVINDSKTMIVRVFNDGRNITDFEVRR